MTEYAPSPPDGAGQPYSSIIIFDPLKGRDAGKYVLLLGASCENNHRIRSIQLTNPTHKSTTETSTSESAIPFFIL